MDTLLEILQDLHPEVDFETCTTLVDDKIIDSFDNPISSISVSVENNQIQLKIE